MDQPIAPSLQARRRQRTALAIGGGVIALLAGAWGLNRMVAPSVARDSLRIVEVHRGAIADTISAAGVVVPVHEEQVVAPARSRVARVLVKPGQVVAAGELLLELDASATRLAIDNLEEQIAQQDIRVQSLSLELGQKQKQLASEIELLALDLEANQVKLDRYQRLLKLGAVSASDINGVELAVKRTQIELRQKRESVSGSRAATQTDVEGARLQAQVLRKALAQQQALLAQAQVRAPFAGMATWLLADVGASVEAGQQVARISELRNFRVEATVSDFYARYLEPGQIVRVLYSGQSMPGRVQTILPEIKDGTVTLVVALQHPDAPLLRNRLRVDAYVVTSQKADTLIASTGPAFNGKGRQDVFLVDGSGAHKVPLEVGLSDGDSVEIVSGAHAGDKLIASDMSRYRDLERIRISN
ncbi:MAG: HlyD family efflux transporter periplasmic adaptor subunit [Arenimonas sp.]